MTPFTVMTWNVRYFSQPSGGFRSSDEGFRKIAAALASEPARPDIVGLQEVEDGSWRGGGEPQLPRLLAALDGSLREYGRNDRYAGLYFPAHRYEAAGRTFYTTGLAALVRDDWEILDHNADAPRDVTHVRIPAFAPFKQRRVLARLRIRRRDPSAATPLAVHIAHLSLPAFLESTGPLGIPSRMGYGSNQIREAEALTAAAADPKAGPALLMGDFNSTPGSPALARLEEAGWRDAHADHASPDDLRRHATAGFWKYRMHLDHILLSPHLRCLSMDAPVFGRGRYADLSDHAPKIARVEVRAP